MSLSSLNSAARPALTQLHFRYNLDSIPIRFHNFIYETYTQTQTFIFSYGWLFVVNYSKNENQRPSFIKCELDDAVERRRHYWNFKHRRLHIQGYAKFLNLQDRWKQG